MSHARTLSDLRPWLERTAPCLAVSREKHMHGRVRPACTKLTSPFFLPGLVHQSSCCMRGKRSGVDLRVGDKKKFPRACMWAADERRRHTAIVFVEAGRVTPAYGSGGLPAIAHTPARPAPAPARRGGQGSRELPPPSVRVNNGWCTAASPLSALASVRRPLLKILTSKYFTYYCKSATAPGS
jgi:hypothetical protein